jgi:hypothetical protein
MSFPPFLTRFLANSAEAEEAKRQKKLEANRKKRQKQKAKKREQKASEEKKEEKTAPPSFSDVLGIPLQHQLAELLKTSPKKVAKKLNASKAILGLISGLFVFVFSFFCF